jgi:hypothetical protein
MIVKEAVNKSNHPVQNPLLFVTQSSVLQLISSNYLFITLELGLLCKAGKLSELLSFWTVFIVRYSRHCHWIQ